jgi:hypothetical protein
MVFVFLAVICRCIQVSLGVLWCGACVGVAGLEKMLGFGRVCVKEDDVKESVLVSPA